MQVHAVKRTADNLAATEAIMETSRSAAGDSGGRIDGRRAASIDLPAPGGPTINTVCRQVELEARS